MRGSYDIVLVSASYCVAVAAAYAALDLASRIAYFEGVRRWLWRTAAALAMGTGIWAAFFVSLKSLQLPMVLRFDVGTTALAWMIAVGVSMISLQLIAGRKPQDGRIIAGGFLLGLGGCASSALGVRAIGTASPGSLEPALLAFAASIAVTAAIAALFIASRLHRLREPRVRWGRLAAGMVMGVAICGPQFAGFAAVKISETSSSAAGNTLDINWMGMPVALLTCVMLAVTVWLSIIDARLLGERRRVARARAEAERIHRLAHYDSATGLPNRSLFMEKLLKQLVSVHNIEGAVQPIGVIYAELTEYRNLVDTLGQDRLNRVLRTISAQLSRELHTGDVLARLSSDGLILMVREQGHRSTSAVLSGFKAQLSTPLQDDGESLRFNWAIGSSRYPEDGNSTQGLIRAAMNTQHHLGAEAVAPAVSTTRRYALAS